MRNQKIIYCVIAGFIALFIVVSTLLAQFNRKPNVIEHNATVVSSSNEIVVTEPSLTCFDFIDKQLTADGFSYLENAKWGRGESNFFIIDVVAQEFQMANELNTKYLKDDWYSVSFERDLRNVYNHADRQIWSYFGLMNGREKVNPSEPNSAAAFYHDVLGAGDYYHELPIWMDYYVQQTNKYGCSLTGLKTENLINEYKTKQSTAKASDVVSVFDRKSDDGVLRFYTDVHVNGAIEDNPRYKELNNYEEYLELHNAVNFETMYFVNVLFHDPTKNLFEPDVTSIQTSILEEFTKDVVFTQTTWINDDPGVETYGIYFIYVDNPNGNFKYMYTEPYKNADNWVYSSFESLKKIKSPYEGNILFVNKGDASGPTYPLQVDSLYESLRWYLYFIEDINPSLKYSEDFIANYTRPFNYSWQKTMGLKELFDTKYGFINRDIKYSWSPNSGY